MPIDSACAELLTAIMLCCVRTLSPMSDTEGECGFCRRDRQLVECSTHRGRSCPTSALICRRCVSLCRPLVLAHGELWYEEGKDEVWGPILRPEGGAPTHLSLRRLPPATFIPNWAYDCKRHAAPTGPMTSLLTLHRHDASKAADRLRVTHMSDMLLRQVHALSHPWLSRTSGGHGSHRCVCVLRGRACTCMPVKVNVRAFLTPTLYMCVRTGRGGRARSFS